MFEMIDGSFEIDSLDQEFLQWVEVTFLEDFLIWKKGERVDCLEISFSNAEVREYTGETIVKKCKIKLAIDEG